MNASRRRYTYAYWILSFTAAGYILLAHAAYCEFWLRTSISIFISHHEGETSNIPWTEFPVLVMRYPWDWAFSAMIKLRVPMLTGYRLPSIDCLLPPDTTSSLGRYT